MTDLKYQALIDDYWAVADVLETLGSQSELFDTLQKAIDILDLEIERMPDIKSLDDEAKVQLAYQYYRLREKYFGPARFNIK